MFGYMIASLENLPPEDKARYQAAYCGLCRALGRQHGQSARLSLTYDMTFLQLLLSSLYEPSEKLCAQRCMVHPMKKHPSFQTECTEYAADMTVLLAYYKCMDDWEDEKGLPQRCYAALLKQRLPVVEQKWPRQSDAVVKSLARLKKIEQERRPPDEAAGVFGLLLGEVFVYRNDLWERPLRRFGQALGRFIYIMDAAVDFEKDRGRGNYNPLLAAGKTPEETEAALELLIGEAAEIFEKLPLVQDAELLRSTLYAGVWRTYRTRFGKEAGQDDTRSV